MTSRRGARELTERTATIAERYPLYAGLGAPRAIVELAWSTAGGNPTALRGSPRLTSYGAVHALLGRRLRLPGRDGGRCAADATRRRLARRVGAVDTPAGPWAGDAADAAARRAGDPRRRARRRRDLDAGRDQASAHAAFGSRARAARSHVWVVIAGACLIALVGAIDDACDLQPLVKLRRPDRGGGDRRRGRGDRDRCDAAVRRVAPVPEHRRRADRDLAGRPDERRQLQRRRRRPGRRPVHDRWDRVLGDRIRPRRQRRRRARRDHRGRRARVPVSQLLPGDGLHG